MTLFRRARGVELRLARQDEGVTALRELHLGTQHVLAEGDASGAPYLRIVQDRLGPTGGIHLHAVDGSGEKDVDVCGRDVELDGLVGSENLELSDRRTCERLAVVGWRAPEIVHRPLQCQLGFGVAARSRPVCQDEARTAGDTRSKRARDDAVLPEDIDLGEERREGDLLLSPRAFDAGARGTQPGAVPQREGDRLLQREGGPFGLEVVPRGWLRGLLFDTAGLDDAFRGVDLELGRDRDASRHSGLRHFRPNGQRPIPRRAPGMQGPAAAVSPPRRTPVARQPQRLRDSSR